LSEKNIEYKLMKANSTSHIAKDTCTGEPRI